MPLSLSDYLALPYRLEVVPGEHGEIFVQYPELPGCMTKVRRVEDVPAIAREILTGWLEIAWKIDSMCHFRMGAAPECGQGRTSITVAP